MPRLSKIGAAALAAFGWTSGANTSISASYLQVAGGGGGGDLVGGGGGAGGYLTGSVTLNTTLSYTVVVGAGGAGGVYGGDYGYGSNGSLSQIGSLTASVGGGAAGPGNGSNGLAGGSGGGGGASSGSAGTGGAATSGQGNAGGAAQVGNGGSTQCSGGGGGAGAVGANASNSGAGNGGVGLASSISGTSTYYAGGGGGGQRLSSNPGGTGGNGGGGNGVNGSGTVGLPGSQNTGGGGGGAGYNNGATYYSGGNGGSGIVIISYLGAQQFGGGVVTSVGGYTIHTFTTSGTLSPLSSLSADYLIVAGGGGGGGNDGTASRTAGGGGAGGLLSGSAVTIDTNSTYLVTVGSGGAAGVLNSVSGTSGSNSSFSIVSTAAVGGGGGGSTRGNSGLNGGSGGGAGDNAGAAGLGTSGQGNNGGGSGGVGTAGGGGGAGSAGSTSAGGSGSASSLSGSSVTYAAGGAPGQSSPATGAANTGNGGGGTVTGSNTGYSGGSGIVIIRYAGSTQQMAGGTVTITGGYVIHTFTSTGYLAPLKLVNNSLRFRSSATAYLTRTPKVASSRTTWTISAWVKRGVVTTGAQIMNAGDGNNLDDSLTFNTASPTINFYVYSTGFVGELKTTAVYRDPAAWYHVVAVWDTTQATSSNRMRLYVNGSQVTAFGTANYPSQNAVSSVNNTVEHDIGRFVGNAGYFDGYMTEFNFIDGQALTPNSFGTFNSYGVWQPITYGGSYGTNGFYLPFNRNSSTYSGYFVQSSAQYLNVGSLTVNWSTYGNWTAECYFNIQSFPANPLPLFGTGGTGNTIAYVYSNGSIGFGINGVNEFISATGIVQTGVWYHIAFVRNSSNIFIYLNGQVVASTSTASTYLSNTSNAFKIGFTVSPYIFNGYLSNFRFTNTVVYSSAFTPSTSNLTAVSGTQLLTLQNATIVDNSSNAYTITNVNGVTTTTQYPFSYGIPLDYSSLGNNWTPSNINTALVDSNAGIYFDSMADVPTLTSATNANYCVLNPLDAGTNLTFSNGNLQISSSANPQNSTRGTIGMTTGKFYWEVVVTTGSPGCVVGIAGPTFSVSSNFSGQMYGYDSNGQKIVNGTSSAYGASWAATDLIGVAFDADALTITFYKNNTSQGTITGVTSGIVWRPFMHANGVTANINFGQRPFSYTPPSGYVALNTYNM